MIRTSFQLIRTNPLLTTNIKLVVSSLDKLYLESFNSSSDLSSNKFKHFSINKNDYLEDKIPKFYDKLPSDMAFYVRYDNDASSTYSDYSYQFDTTYLSGANKVEDTWYEEEFEYFAPLYIRNTSLPSNFIILRCDDPSNYNLDNNNNFELSTLNKNNFYSEIIDKWKCIKVFDLTTKSNFGKFLDKNYTSNSRFPTVPFYFDVRKTEFSKWYGMDYDSGIYTEKDFYLEDTLSIEQLHFRMEKLITEGYKNNKLIFPNILNLKFLFDDTPATPNNLKKYSMNRYYGFYSETMDFVGSITSYITPEIKSGLWLINNIIVSGSTGTTSYDSDSYQWQYPSINPFVENWDDTKNYYIFLDNTNDFYRKKLISGLYPVKKVIQNGVQVFKIISDDIMDKIWDDPIGDPSGITSLKYHPQRVNIKTCNIEYQNFNILTNYSTDFQIDWYYENSPISGQTQTMNYMYGDLYLIEIDGMFHVLKNGTGITYSDFNFNNKNEVINKYYIQTDWGINSNSENLEYWINGKNSEFYRSLKTESKDSQPLQFNIYKIKFSDIKDFDFERINSNFSNFDYEQTYYVDTPEEKLYAIDYTDTSIPRDYKNEKYGTSFQYKISNVSSEYIADDELFEIKQYPFQNPNSQIDNYSKIYKTGDRYQTQLSDIWRKNQTICKWGFMGSISHSDYDYKLNNSLSVGGTFNKTIDPFLTHPDVLSKNLDYFYRIGNFYNSNPINKQYYKFQSTNIDGDFIFSQEGLGFDIGSYFNTDFDYFTYFFKNKMNSLDGGILYNQNYDKYSIFNFGDVSNLSLTLFKGLKISIKSIDNIDIVNNKIYKILYNTNKNFNDYKFSIILNEYYNSETSSNIKTNGIVNNDIIIENRNGINIILNEKWKNILIIINFVVSNNENDAYLNDLNKYDEKNGLYYGLKKDGSYISNYNSIFLTAYNFITLINNTTYQDEPYINYYYITQYDNQTYTGMTNNFYTTESTMVNIPNWQKPFSPFLLYIDYPDSIHLNSQKNYKIEPYKGPDTKSIMGYSLNEPISRIVNSLQDDKPQISSIVGVSTNLIPSKNEIFRFSGPYEPIFNDINLFRGGLYYYTNYSRREIYTTGITEKFSSNTCNNGDYNYNYLWTNCDKLCDKRQNPQINIPPTIPITTNNLLISNFNFDGSIPIDAIISGITITINRRHFNANLYSDNYVKDYEIIIIKSGLTSTNYANLDTNWGETFQEFSYGSGLWGFESMSTGDLNTNLSVSITCEVYNNEKVTLIMPQIRCVYITISYYYNRILFDYTSSIFMDNNVKFDTTISDFGMINNFTFSKVNENSSILKINQDKDTSVYPMIDEYGYSYYNRFIFKSPWDRNFFIRTNSSKSFDESTVTLNTLNQKYSESILNQTNQTNQQL